nr:LarC family nickel insertion protein [Lachnospiraceae bacterium]
LLYGIPAYATELRGELCTPTGAALLRHFVKDFGPMPRMRIEKIGYGTGKKEFIVANCVRAMLGDTEVSFAGTEEAPVRSEAENAKAPAGCERDAVVELSCNIDDMTGEEMGAAMDVLLQGGAKDVFVTSVMMKKCRPGFHLHIICAPEDEEKMVKLAFANTTTIGIRRQFFDRYVMKRSVEELESDYGTVHYKRSEGYGVVRTKPEYEDVKELADKQGETFLEAEANIRKHL